jgi:Skp1 family, dimerisation domain/Skp1 family, tetramerisation domain
MPKTIVCKDGREFTIEKRFAAFSELIAEFFRDNDDSDEKIPLLNVTGSDFKALLAYHDFIVRENVDADGSFFDAYSMMDLLSILEASNYLNCSSIIQPLSKTIAKRLKGLTREEMRAALNIENDFTSEEEKRILAETSWALR